MRSGRANVAATACALVATIVATSGSAQESEERLRPRVLVIRPATARRGAGLEGLVGALRPIFASEIEVSEVRAELPHPNETDRAAWGASVARSEGADAVLWVEPGRTPGTVVLWVVRLGDGEEVEFASTAAIEERRTFDRARSLALAARPLLEPILDGRRRAGRAEPADPAEPGPEPAPDEAVPAEVTPPDLPERASEPEIAPPTTETAPPEAVPAVASQHEAGQRSPIERSEPSDPAMDPPPRAADGAAAPLEIRLAAGPALRSEGASPAIRLNVEISFLRHGWAQLAGELLREEPLPRIAVGRRRQRGYASIAAGGEVSWAAIRARLGASFAVVPVESGGAQPLFVGITIGAVASVAVAMVPGFFAELPVWFDVALARGDPHGLPVVEAAFALLLGVEIEP